MKKSLYFTVTLASMLISYSLTSRPSVPFWEQPWFENYSKQYETVLTGDKAQLSNPEVIEEINQFLKKINLDPSLTIHQKYILVNILGSSAQRCLDEVS